MKKASLLILLLLGMSPAFGQTVVRLGDLPKSEYTINIYQVYGFQEGYEGYKVIYVDSQNQPKYLYLPVELHKNYRIFKPQENTNSMHFVIIWKKGERIERVEWYMPRAINYDLPNFVVSPFEEKDKIVFQKIVQSGELMLGVEVGGIAPVIKAPGGGN